MGDNNGFTPMSQTSAFPKDFWWGTATASHQVEGNNVNNDTWALEHTPGTIHVEPSGDAIDHYHRYREDIALLGQLGFNLYRFSLEWSRIEPEDGHFSTAALDHYRRMLAACHENSLTPMVTFHHFTAPRWLMAQGGWGGVDTAAKFARFCERAMRHFGDLMGAACTLNEVNISRLIASAGFLPPRDVLVQAPWWQAVARQLNTSPADLSMMLFASSAREVDTIMSAHRQAVTAIKAANGKIPVGITLAMQEIQPVQGGEETAAQMRESVHNDYLDRLAGDDFIGVQTYSRVRVGPDGPVRAEPDAEVTQMGYEFYPEALEATIREATARTRLPAIVTENGIGTGDDTRRIEYVRRALRGVHNCLRDGIDVRGYTYWSAFDNYEWSLGYRPTFGIIGVDRRTQLRTAKPSAHWLGALARANGATLFD